MMAVTLYCGCFLGIRAPVVRNQVFVKIKREGKKMLKSFARALLWIG